MIPKKVCLMIPVLILLLISNLLFVWTAKGTSVDEMTLHIPGETQRTVDGNPVLVAGLWHYLNITLDSEPSKLSIIMYKGDSIPSTGGRNENTYYAWEYDGNWKDMTGYGGGLYSYINEPGCKKTGNTYSFYIGIKPDVVENADVDTIDFDTWTLEIESDNTMIKKSDLIVEESIIGFAQKSAEFYLNAEPFTSTVIEPDHTFGIINSYNIPFAINITYTQFTDNINTTNKEITVHPQETSTHEISIQTLPWPPGIITIEGIVKATPLHIMETGFVSLPSAPVQYFPLIKIYVGHENYIIFESTTTDIVFQYEEKLEAEYDEIRSIVTYISGNGNVTIKSITVESATLLDVFHENNEIEQMPYIIQSTNASEQSIITNVRFTEEDTTALIQYELGIDGENQTFTTQVEVGPKPQPKEQPQDTTLTIIIVGICITAVIGFLIYNHTRR